MGQAKLAQMGQFCVAVYTGPGEAGTAAHGPREAGHGLRLDGPAMIAYTRCRIAPFREGQGVRARAAFTRGACVGYNAHHEGVRHVARCAAVMAAKGRGPPVTTR